MVAAAAGSGGGGGSMVTKLSAVMEVASLRDWPKKSLLEPRFELGFLDSKSSVLSVL